MSSTSVGCTTPYSLLPTPLPTVRVGTFYELDVIKKRQTIKKIWQLYNQFHYLGATLGYGGTRIKSEVEQIVGIGGTFLCFAARYVEVLCDFDALMRKDQLAGELAILFANQVDPKKVAYVYTLLDGYNSSAKLRIRGVTKKQHRMLRGWLTAEIRAIWVYKMRKGRKSKEEK